MSYDYFGGFDVTILDANGSIVKPKKDPRAEVMIARTNYWEISPRSKDDRGILMLSRFYELDPGKYRVKVSRTISIIGKQQKLFIESDLLAFAVTAR